MDYRSANNSQDNSRTLIYNRDAFDNSAHMLQGMSPGGSEERLNEGFKIANSQYDPSPIKEETKKAASSQEGGDFNSHRSRTGGNRGNLPEE